jgi:hypothetical protein
LSGIEEIGKPKGNDEKPEMSGPVKKPTQKIPVVKKKKVKKSGAK